MCVQLMLQHLPDTQLCLSRAHLNDGKWHSVKANRYGEWLEMMVDEGDGPLYNTTPTPSSLLGWTLPLMVDRHEGVHVGGSPDLPLPPLLNSSTWAQATMFTNVHATCLAPPVCANVSCSEPLTCVDVWRRHECGCGEGAALMRETGTCRDVNECLWSPCFNGGTCINREPGYLCLCTKSFTGEHCEVTASRYTSLTLSFSALVIVLILSVMILAMVLGVYILYQRRRRRMRKSVKAAEEFTVSAKISQELENVDIPGGENTDLKVACSKMGHRQSSVTKDTKLTAVDVLRRDKSDDGKEAAPESGCGCPHLPSLDDLRYYAYEGDGSSPGSLSSCCSGVDGVDEVRLLGGFQDVAALLNCLVGQQNTQSPLRQHSQATTTQQMPDTLSTSVATVNVNGCKHENKSSSPSKKLKSNSGESEDGVATVTYEAGIQSALIYRKWNSLPRSRAPKIFVNNLHDYTRDAVGCSVDRGCYSLRRNIISSAAVTDTLLPGTCYSKTHTCCTKIPPPMGFEENSLSVLSSGRDTCQACNVATLLCDDKCKNLQVPRRSRSTSTVSYIASRDKALGSCSCSVVQPLPGVPCSQPSCEQQRTSSYSGLQLADASSAGQSPGCPCTNTQISVISTKTHKGCGSDKLFLL
ncbi:Neural-cadherin-like 4 [Homarus americanus]|uniref:Neural-cadherin-like 4 n=1 Tax=Homarus americanus TaxID=6706 RepID=A0A8J5MUL3_HOMAM|nr:Neural-cadherin-like 4 [Homarus americanus]